MRPGLRAVFVGINPTPVSVQRRHYYQGRHGRTFWRRLQESGLAADLPAGHEDERAYALGFGFADVVRRPTRRSDELSGQELREGVPKLVDRLLVLGEPRPLVVFLYKTAESMAAAALQEAGFPTFRLPGPCASREKVTASPLELTKVLAQIKAA